MTIRMYLTKVISVMVQKMMVTAPNTSDAVGSDEKTLGKVYRGEVPAEQHEGYENGRGKGIGSNTACFSLVTSLDEDKTDVLVPRSPNMTPTAW